MERFGTLALISAIALGLLQGCGAGESTPGGAGGGSPDAMPGAESDSAVGLDAGQDADGPEPTTCGSNTCEATSITLDATAIGEIAACCADGDACGLLLEPTREFGVTVPNGCTPVEATGRPTEECPSVDYVLPMLPHTETLLGCCRPSGECGVIADLSNVVVPEAGTLAVANLGCVDPRGFVTEAADPGPCTYEAAK